MSLFSAFFSSKPAVAPKPEPAYKFNSRVNEVLYSDLEVGSPDRLGLAKETASMHGLFAIEADIDLIIARRRVHKPILDLVKAVQEKIIERDKRK